MLTQLPDSADLFATGADAIVNPVNCVGVMGAGLALAFKKRHPGAFRAYAAWCAQSASPESLMGQTLSFDLGEGQSPRWILMTPTKVHWKNPSQPEYVSLALDSLVQEAQRLGLGSCALPALGCGLGGLDFDAVFWPLAQQKLSASATRFLAIAPKKPLPRARFSPSRPQ